MVRKKRDSFWACFARMADYGSLVAVSRDGIIDARNKLENRSNRSRRGIENEVIL
jgi:hypothetical protein